MFEKSVVTAPESSSAPPAAPPTATSFEAGVSTLTRFRADPRRRAPGRGVLADSFALLGVDGRRESTIWRPSHSSVSANETPDTTSCTIDAPTAPLRACARTAPSPQMTLTKVSDQDFDVKVLVRRSLPTASFPATASLPLTLTLARRAQEADHPVIIDFAADYCGPCKLVEPALQRLDKHDDVQVLKAQLDKNKALRICCCSTTSR